MDIILFTVKYGASSEYHIFNIFIILGHVALGKWKYTRMDNKYSLGVLFRIW
jgi:hypothetical protein